jgi:hypothetical protein
MPINTISQLNLTVLERSLRMNIRNAWLAESVEDVRVEAVSRAGQGKWFEAAVLFELALDD